MPPKKRKTHSFNHTYTTQYGSVTPFHNGAWHSHSCEDHTECELDTKLSSRIFKGYQDVGRYICWWCRLEIYISLTPTQYARWHSTMNTCVRQWRRFRVKRRLTLQTTLVHTCNMIDRIAEIIFEYVDTQPTQSTGLRLKEQVVLPMCDYNEMPL